MPDQVRDIMDSNPATVAPETSVQDVVATLREHQLPGVPVVEEGRLVGVVTRLDVLGALTA